MTIKQKKDLLKMMKWDKEILVSELAVAWLEINKLLKEVKKMKKAYQKLTSSFYCNTDKFKEEAEAESLAVEEWLRKQEK